MSIQNQIAKTHGELMGVRKNYEEQARRAADGDEIAVERMRELRDKVENLEARLEDLSAAKRAGDAKQAKMIAAEDLAHKHAVTDEIEECNKVRYGALRDTLEALDQAGRHWARFTSKGNEAADLARKNGVPYRDSLNQRFVAEFLGAKLFLSDARLIAQYSDPYNSQRHNVREGFDLPTFVGKQDAKAIASTRAALGEPSDGPEAA